MPCPGHNGRPCPHEFKYAQLVARLERTPPKLTIECPESGEDVDVRELLFGLAPSTLDDVNRKIDQLHVDHQLIDGKQDATLAAVQELTQLTQRQFLAYLQVEQENFKAEFPRVFTLRPQGSGNWARWLKSRVAGEKLILQLYCEAPGCWHPSPGGRYEIARSAAWLTAMAPYISGLVQVLKYAAPLAGPAIGIAAAPVAAAIDNELKLMQELVKHLPDVEHQPDRKSREDLAESPDPQRRQSRSLHALGRLLDQQDPNGRRYGLTKLITKQGHIFWLCDHHYQEYQQRERFSPIPLPDSAAPA